VYGELRTRPHRQVTYTNALGAPLAATSTETCSTMLARESWESSNRRDIGSGSPYHEPSTQMNEQRIIALLGRRDEPTDAVEQYCRYLGEALRSHGFAMQFERVAWNEQGWSAALRELRQKARGWRDCWVLVQYTALAWSGRGFPLRFLPVLNRITHAGARMGIVYHDAEPYSGDRFVDKMRSAAQLRVMRHALRTAKLAVFTGPLDSIRWLGGAPSNAAFIPVGANFVAPTCKTPKRQSSEPGTVRVAVFGVTEWPTGRWEAAQIIDAVSLAARQIDQLDLSVFGRGAADFESVFRDGLRDAAVKVHVKGVLPAEQVASELCSSDVMLFVRGAVSTRRGSAIAGIACGLPVVGYKDRDIARPVAEAGVVLVPRGSPDLGKVLLQVLSNDSYRQQLAEASRRAYEQYFSWAAIAAQYAEELQKRTDY
jgi:glycosyltransferase involved in cell wall biosynthesis